MNQDVRPTPAPQPSALGDRIRNIARQLRQEEEIQIKATSRVLGAAAQLSENHERLISEVTEMIEEDLEAVDTAQPLYTVEQLQQQFAKFDNAKAYFGMKALGWDALVKKLNTQSQTPNTDYGADREQKSQSLLIQRLEAIEQTMQLMRGDIGQMQELLSLVAAKLLG
ncbi:hypothetical protein [Sphaerothrix gracilis]|uniref:hypothetical protein n=1 Tax=Sphaerothrix gracilis TaxID=3151835 RepID=UPI0031FDC153